MARLAACLGALALVWTVGSPDAPAHASTDGGGGASAPQAAIGTGGLSAPRTTPDAARFAQADPLTPEPPAEQPPPAPLGEQPGEAPDEAPDGDAPAPAEPPRDDRGVGVVVPLPEEAVEPRTPMTVATPATTLPRTGQDTDALALIGLLLLAAGGAVRSLSRPRDAASA